MKRFLPVAFPSGKGDNTSLIESPVRTVGVPTEEMDEPVDVEFRVIGESVPIEVLVAETYEPEGPWSPDSAVDRYLAPIRQAKLEAERREQLQRLTEDQRRLCRPSKSILTRLWRSVTVRLIRRKRA